MEVPTSFDPLGSIVNWDEADRHVRPPHNGYEVEALRRYSLRLAARVFHQSVKWGVHPAGDRRAEWERTTLLILISGKFRIDLSIGSKVLEQQGDYAMWGEGIDHSWEALEDSVVVTVRWPSTP